VIFQPTTLDAAFMVELERRYDERGFFARTWCAEEFGARGLAVEIAQCSLSYNRSAGTLRGMHYQAPPHAETKLVRCTRGAIYDVLVDLRPSSPSYLRWIGVELSADNGRMVYAPEGLAHGFQTLTDDAEVAYQMSVPYHREAERGVRYDDPAFAIQWPLPVRVISSKDAAWPEFVP
jgi:dTDP-4-dehydrorhamnose 3,5-epimerase